MQGNTNSSILTCLLSFQFIQLSLSFPSLPRWWRTLRRLVYVLSSTSPPAPICLLRLLQLHIMSVISLVRRRSVCRRRCRVVAVVVIRLLVVGVRVIGRWSVPRWCASEGPASATVRLRTNPASTAGGNAAEGGEQQEGGNDDDG